MARPEQLLVRLYTRKSKLGLCIAPKGAKFWGDGPWPVQPWFGLCHEAMANGGSSNVLAIQTHLSGRPHMHAVHHVPNDMTKQRTQHASWLRTARQQHALCAHTMHAAGGMQVQGVLMT